MTITHTSTATAVEWDAPPSTHGPRLRSGSPLKTRIYIAERTGEQVMEITSLVGELGNLKERLNLHSTGSGMEIPRGNATVYAAATPLARELQIWIGDELRCAGPILSRSISSEESAWGLGYADCWWYFTGLYRGGYQPWSRNFFQNYRFDADFARWVKVGTTVTLDATHVTDGGTQAAMIDNDADASIAQTIRIDLDTTYSAVIDFKVWIESGITSGAGLVVDVPGVPSAYGAIPITSATPRAQWTTLRAVVEIDGRVGARDLTAKLHGAPGGKIWLGSAVATIFPISAISDEVEGAVLATQVDIATILSDAILATNSGLNIGVDAPLTGELVEYKPADDVDVYVSDIARRLEDRDPGIEIRMAYGAEGTVRTVVADFERSGVDLTPEELTFSNSGGEDGRGSITSYSFSEDFTKAVNEVTTIGDGDYRGTSLNEDAFGGVIRQKTQQAPPGTPLADLEGMSRRAQRLTAADIQTFDVTGRPWVTPLVHKGDRVLVDITDDTVAISDVYRVIDIDIDLATCAATFTLNLEPSA